MCSIYVLIYNLNYIFWGELFVTLLCSSKQIVDLRKHVSFIRLELYYMLALSESQLHLEIM